MRWAPLLVLVLVAALWADDTVVIRFATTTTTGAATTTTTAAATTTTTIVTTTTTTVTTTTTTVPLAMEMLPALTDVAFQGSGASTMRCVRFIAQHSLSSATKLAAGFIAASGGPFTCGVGLYPDSDGGSALASASGTCTTAGDIVSTSSASFSITDGTVYRLCACATNLNAQFLATDDTSTGNGHLGQLFNSVTATVATAANTCSSGSPPSTTGALTGATNFRPPVAWIAQ